MANQCTLCSKEVLAPGHDDLIMRQLCLGCIVYRTHHAVFDCIERMEFINKDCISIIKMYMTEKVFLEGVLMQRQPGWLDNYFKHFPQK